MNSKEHKTFINKLNEEEVKELSKLLSQGKLRKNIEERLEKFKNPKKVCPVCNTAINEDEGLTLIFGSKEFKKKATFDAIDCLEYFLSKLK